jgi:hypothetical protein
MYKSISFSKQGMWILHLDPENFAAVWDKVQMLYLDLKLPGVMKLSTLNHHTAGEASRCILFFAGPIEDEPHITSVGKTIIDLTCHKRQNCNFSWPGVMYFKAIRSKSPMYVVKYE